MERLGFKTYSFSVNPYNHSKDSPIPLPPRLEERVHGKRYYIGEHCPLHDEPLIGIWSGNKLGWQRPPGCPSCDPFYASYRRIISLDTSELPLRYRFKTLNDFIAQEEGPRLALTKARQFLEGQFRTGMIFIGGVGTGKTHLAAGIVREWIKEKNELALYATASNIIDTIKSTFTGDRGLSTDKVNSKFISPSLLVIDELGFGFQTEFEHLTLAKICLRRFDQCRPTILISNLDLNELTLELGERVLDRFREEGELVPFHWGSVRGNNFFNVSQQESQNLV